ncbi:MAG: serine/threonine-protein kinase, partial [Planctomycetota bacterium]
MGLLPPDPLIGTTLGGFHVTALLAQGGYGRVYEAEQVSLGRKAALKVTDPRTLNTPVKQKRFLREAEILARFVHPNIVQIYEAGRDGELYFLAMEFVEGRNLQDRIDKGELLSPVEAWGVARAGLAALARAHKEGVIHRDVKPGNLLLPVDGEAKLSDFGLAKDLGSAALTDPGIILGTPMYMSPEQAHGGEP